LLLDSARADFAVAFFDIELAFAEQPVAQMAVNFVDAPLQILRRHLGVVARELRLLNFFEKPGGESIRVGFDQTDESVGKHHDPYPPISSVCFPADRSRDSSHLQM
jgi:hypothetical protein